MERMWCRRPSAAVSVREVLTELRAERDIAYTTVMSTMDNLHTKGWLARERHGRAYRYHATMTREERSARLMSTALAGGRAARPRAQLLRGADGARRVGDHSSRPAPSPLQRAVMATTCETKRVEFACESAIAAAPLDQPDGLDGSGSLRHVQPASHIFSDGRRLARRRLRVDQADQWTALTGRIV